MLLLFCGSPACCQLCIARRAADSQATGESHSFGILQHTGPPVQDDIPGLYRDGRVRNPVPSKLKGKTDARKGNFGVMHIDLTTTNEIQERDAAAKRTSEGTQLAAKLAQTDRYVPIRRSKFAYRPGDRDTSTYPPAPRHRTSPLTAAETKTEQARLLTLLRGLHPVLVVDQLCKALAFFGGVPGAAYTDESFPDSAESNGPGSLFIGWLAEIFPALGPKSLSNSQQSIVKRPRGRPRGSKNAKGKKEKSLRKRILFGARSLQTSEGRLLGNGSVQEGPADDSWVDIEDAAPLSDGGNATGTRRDATADDTVKVSHESSSVAGPSVSVEEEPISAVPDASCTPPPRRRGRPKGSKNRPKDGVPVTNSEQQKAPVTDHDIMPASTGSEVSSIKKRKPGPGRPKGSKNRPKEPRTAVQTGNGHRQLVENSQHHGQERNMVDHGTAGLSSHHPSISAPTGCGSAEPMGPSNAVRMTPSEVSRQCPAEVSEAVSIISGELRGAKRKRKAPTTDPNVAQATGPASIDPEVATQIAIDTASDPVTREVPASEMTTNAVPLGQPGNGMQQSAKRRKPMKEIPRQPASRNRFGSSSDHSQTVSTTVATSSHTSQQRPSTEQINIRNANAEDHAEIIPSQTISQMSMSISHSTHSQSTSSHQDGPELRGGFSPSRAPSSIVHQAHANESMAAGAYPISLAGDSPTSMYSNSHSVQGQFEHQVPQRQQRQSHSQQRMLHQQLQAQQRQLQQHEKQQLQEPRQKARVLDRSHMNQHHRVKPTSGPISSSVGRDTNAFGGPANDGVYQGLMTQQSPFGTQMAMVTSPDGHYRNPARRSGQNQSPAFQNRQVQHAAPTGMPSFHDYSDPAFLEMTGLDSTSQASLSMGQQPYGMTSNSIQRPSSSLGAPYQTASEISHSASFDGSVTESTLRERMYHTLRRQ
ncbi:hypothetical protein CCHR01_09162 [Colletotrichum chrysophilum]|uniref:DNA binding domain with preference for A/T rich regions-like protein n=1 Tax=Colletotrichum chrysophilum TaxID=1836956 RepID=A0AAD9AHK7_9PEZI|nr:hypothetical protein CCHR01_09162 [Colletotrichum chrysophilum]